MTFIVGWKYRDRVFLCADAAITHNDDPKSGTRSKTSFGEAVFEGGGRRVTEDIIKLFNLGSIALAISGDVAGARDFIHDLSIRLKEGVPAPEAFKATALNRVPMHTDYCIFAGCYERNGPARLFSFNLGGSQCAEEHQNGTMLQGGNIHTPAGRYFQQIHPSVFQTEIYRPPLDANPDLQLALYVAVLQSISIHFPMMNQGIGGAFFGIIVDGGGIRWQRDTLFVTYDLPMCIDGMISEIVRDNVLVVRSNVNSRTLYLGDTLMGSVPTADPWKAKWWDKACEHIRTGFFEYVVFLSKKHWSVTLVEMRQQLLMRYMHIYPPKVQVEDGKPFSIGLNLHEKVMRQVELIIDRKGRPEIPCIISVTPFDRFSIGI